MPRRNNSWWAAVSIMMSAMLLVPALGLAKDRPGENYREHMARMVKELNLSPEKTKEFQAVQEKYQKERQEIFASLQKYMDELEKVLSAPKPDEGKVKELVKAISSNHDKLGNSFKSQREGELTVMNPIQQGKYLLALSHWRQEMMEKYGKSQGGEAGKKMEKK